MKVDGWLPTMVVVLTLTAGVGTPAAAGERAADERDARIAALEARIAQLEVTVRRLTEDGSVRQAVAGELATASLVTAAAPSAVVTRPPQETASPTGSRMPQELLPALGKIGATASFSAGVQSGAFSQRAGPYVGGGIDLPLFPAAGGRILYEFRAGIGASATPTHVTSNVAQVANLAVLANTHPLGGAANVEAALAGRTPAPFAVHYDVTSRMRLVDVMPFGLKYVNTSLDRLRLRPYAAVGVGFLVAISDQRTSGGQTGAFEGSLIGGQITAASELTATEVPSGQGNMYVGVQAGGGLEWRLRPGLSFAFDARGTRVTGDQWVLTTAVRTGLHF